MGAFGMSKVEVNGAGTPRLRWRGHMTCGGRGRTCNSGCRSPLPDPPQNIQRIEKDNEKEMVGRIS